MELLAISLLIPSFLAFYTGIYSREPKRIGHTGAITALVAIATQIYSYYYSYLRFPNILIEKIRNNPSEVINLVRTFLYFFSLFIFILILSFSLTRITNKWQKTYEKNREKRLKVYAFIVGSIIFSFGAGFAFYILFFPAYMIQEAFTAVFIIMLINFTIGLVWLFKI